MYYNISITSSKYICLSDFLSSFRSCSVCPEPGGREGGRERGRRNENRARETLVNMSYYKLYYACTIDQYNILYMLEVLDY